MSGPREMLSIEEIQAKAVLSPDEAAALLSCSAQFIYRQAASGELPSYKLGRLVRFHRADIDAWLQRHRRERKVPRLNGGEVSEEEKRLAVREALSDLGHGLAAAGRAINVG